MLILTAPNGSPLTFPSYGGSAFLAFDGTHHATGKVALMSDATIKAHVAQALPKTHQPDHHFSYMEAKDVMRDVRWIAKALAAAEAIIGADGIAFKQAGRGVTIDIPAAAKPAKAEVAVGAQIAVGPSISPKALMNVRGEVTAIAGGKATVRIDEGDRSRLNRATGKAWGASVKLPLACCEPV